MPHRRLLTLAVLGALSAPGGCAGHRATSARTASNPLVSPSSLPASPAPVTTAVADADAATSAAAPDATQATSTGTPDAFHSDIKPILFQRCVPCHVPGGSMYGKMPFDDPATVARHPEGILKRIKDPADREKLERWFASRRP